MSEEKENEIPVTDKKEEKEKEEKKAESSSKPQEEKEEAKEKKDSKKEAYENEIAELKKKVFDYQAKFEEADKKADEWKNKYYQVYADMSNTRKQLEKESADFKKYAKKSLIEELIPALDGFDMALKKEPEDETLKKYLQGFKMIHTKLIEVLKSQNVTIISPKPGDDYDPNTMQAFSTVEGEEDNKVADVFTKGYQMYEHLLRPCGVIVTKKKEEKVEEKKSDSPEKESEAEKAE